VPPTDWPLPIGPYRLALTDWPLPIGPYRLALTHGLPMDDLMGKPRRQDNPFSLNTPLDRVSLSQFQLWAKSLSFVNILVRFEMIETPTR